MSSLSSTKSADGLGPLFNARSCQRCHLKDGRGHPPAANWPDDDAVSMFLRLSIPPQNEEQRRRLAKHRALTIPEPIYGGQLQDLVIQGHRAEGRMHIEYEEKPVLLADGETASLRKPAYTVTNWNYGPPHPVTADFPPWQPRHFLVGSGTARPQPFALEDSCGIASRTQAGEFLLTSGSGQLVAMHHSITLHTTQPARLRESVGTTIFHGFTISVQVELTGGA